MKKNMSISDRVLRMIGAIIIMDLALEGRIPGNWEGPAWTVAALLELTGLAAWSPLYAVFHWHTNSNKHNRPT